MRQHMKAERLVRGDWVEYQGREWIVAAHPAPDELATGEQLVLRLSRIDGAQAELRAGPSEPVMVTRLQNPAG